MSRNGWSLAGFQTHTLDLHIWLPPKKIQENSEKENNGSPSCSTLPEAPRSFLAQSFFKLILNCKNKGFCSSNYLMYEEGSRSHGSWFYPELKILLTKYSWEYLCYSYRKYYLKNEIDFTCPQKTHPPTQPLSFLCLLL